MRQPLPSALLLLVVAAVPCVAEEPVPPEALRRMEGILGTWDSTWNRLGPDGEVVASFEGTEDAAWAIEGRVVLLTTRVPSQSSHSKAFMYYSEIDQLFHLVSVDARGDLWHLTGGLDEFVLTSGPRRRPDGTEFFIRFTHDEADARHFSALMEMSFDGGATWIPATRQELVKRAGDSPPPAG